MWPRPRATMPAATACVTRIRPVTLVSMMLAHSSRSPRSKRRRPPTSWPAQLTRMSSARSSPAALEQGRRRPGVGHVELSAQAPALPLDQRAQALQPAPGADHRTPLVSSSRPATAAPMLLPAPVTNPIAPACRIPDQAWRSLVRCSSGPQPRSKGAQGPVWRRAPALRGRPTSMGSYFSTLAVRSACRSALRGRPRPMRLAISARSWT